MFNSLNINTSALTSHRLYLDAVSNNIANMNTSRGVDGTTYKRQEVVFSEFEDAFNKRLGVKATKIEDASRNDRLVYDKDNPDADENGYVHYPDINMSEEMTDLLNGQRGYQVNLSAVNVNKEVIKNTLDIGR